MTTLAFRRTRRLLITAALLALMPPASRSQAQAAPQPKPRVYAVVFLASWCANCKELGPKAAHVLPPFLARGVVPVQLDMSDEAARQKSLRTAQKLGLGPIAAGEDGTGFIVLVDAKKKTRLGRVTSNLTEAQMTGAFQQALSQSASH